MLDDRYVAGLFDGEGYIRIAKWKKPNSMHIRYSLFGGIGMTHRPIIEQLHAQYGGSLNQNRHDLRKSTNKIQFNWIFSSQSGASFLRRILPFSVVKRDEIEIALKLQRQIDDNPYVPGGRHHMNERKGREEMMACRETLFQEITALKKRAYSPLLISGPKVSELSLTR